jgi:asparagine synthase (glutamine-hydrolysing)
VPVGAYLSGGLDSSTITTLVHRYTPNHLETFSIAFTDAAFDESPFQEQMAAALGTRHNLVTCSHEDIGMAFPDVIWHTEAPLLRTSPVPLYLLSRLVHEHNFKVVLTGEGADEFLGGYNIFKEAKIRRFWARQPESTMRPALLKKLYAYVGNLAEGNFAYLQRFFGQGLEDGRSVLLTSHSLAQHGAEQALFLGRAAGDGQRQWTRRRDAGRAAAAFQAWSPLAQAQYLEATIFLPEYLLSSQGDRVGMAHSVEGRFPFLDHRVVEFCNALPAHYKLRGLRRSTCSSAPCATCCPRRSGNGRNGPIARRFTARSSRTGGLSTGSPTCSRRDRLRRPASSTRRRSRAWHRKSSGPACSARPTTWPSPASCRRSCYTSISLPVTAVPSL